jgi:hypothetical protein
MSLMEEPVTSEAAVPLSNPSAANGGLVEAKVCKSKRRTE